MISCHASPVAHLGDTNERHITHARFKRRPAGEPVSCPPEEEEHGLREGLEVVVPVNVCAVHHGDLPKHLKGRDRTNTFSCGPAEATFCHVCCQTCMPITA